MKFSAAGQQPRWWTCWKREGAEAVMPDLLDFLLLRAFYNSNFQGEVPGRHEALRHSLCNAGHGRCWNILRKPASRGAGRTASASLRPRISTSWPRYAKPFVSLGNQTRRGMVPDRRDAGADPQRRQQHCLHPALRLPAEPCCGQGCHQGTAPQLSPSPISSPWITIPAPAK